MNMVHLPDILKYNKITRIKRVYKLNLLAASDCIRGAKYCNDKRRNGSREANDGGNPWELAVANNFDIQF